MVIGQHATAAEDEDAVVVQRRRAVATPSHELNPDDGLRQSHSPYNMIDASDALQLQPEVGPDAELVYAGLYQALNHVIRPLRMKPKLWRRRLVRPPLRYRVRVKDLSPGELIHQRGVVAIFEEFLVHFEVGLGDVFERHLVFRHVVIGAGQEYTHDLPSLPQRYLVSELSPQPAINLQEEFVGRAGENLRAGVLPLAGFG